MQDDPRIVSAKLIDEMRERCGLEADFQGRHGRKARTGARGTGRTTRMLLAALANAGKVVTVVGQVDILAPMITRR